MKTLHKHIFILAAVLLLLPAVGDAAVPDEFSTEVIETGLALPTTFDFAPDGRIFVAEKGGTVRIIKDNELLTTPFIELPNVNTYADRGLIGLALDPAFETNGHVYLSYTYENDPSDPEGPKMAQIVRVTAQGDSAEPGSMVVLAGTETGSPEKPSCNDFATGTDCIPSDSGSHSAGGLRFGPDGKLYATLGDGASFSFVDPNAYKAQDLDWLTGKILRLNKDGTAPADNPYYTGDPNENRSKVFAYGVRNSYRFDFRPETGTLFAGDVGWGGWEEINVVSPGVNLGWPCREGPEPQGSYECTADTAIDPIYTYSHDDGVAAVVGGAFAGAAYPDAYEGSYFFGDFHRNDIYRMDVGANDEFQSVETWYDGSADGPVSILAGPDGSIYYLSIFNGELRHIVHADSQTDPQPPVARNDSVTTLAGQSALITVLDNDSDPNNDPLSLTEVGTPMHGTAANNGDNTITYTPDDSFVGTDAFTYTISDGTFTDSATVTVEVRESGDPSAVDLVHVSLTKDVTDPVVGETTTFTATVRNDGEAGPFLVDFELYSAATEERVDYEVYENEFIGAGETRSFTFEWTPPLSGSYWLSVGYFYPDWSVLHHWEEKGLQFEVFDREPTGEPFDLLIDDVAVSDGSIALGDPITATATISNTGGSGNGLVDIEVTNEAGEVVHQEFFDNEVFGELEVRTFSSTWVPENEGIYYVDAGTFGAGWDPFMAWAWHAAEFTVDADTGSSATRVVYDDALAPAWSSWSWDTTIDFAETGTVQSGTAAMSVSYAAPWAGVYLRTGSPFPKDELNALSVSLHGGSSTGQALQLKIVDPDGVVLYEEALPALTDTWQEFSIPLDAISGSAEIAGVMVMGRTGETEAPYFMDEVLFE